MRHVLVLVVLTLLVSSVLAKGGKKRSRWTFGDDQTSDVSQRKSEKRHKSMLGNLFTAKTTDSAEVVDLDALTTAEEEKEEENLSLDAAADEWEEAVDLDHEHAPSASSHPVVRNRNVDFNPCQDHACEEGEECVLDDSWTPSCKCRSSCYDPQPQEQVCSNYNDTFPSRCHLERERCLCQKHSVQCQDRKNKHAHVEYNAKCQELPVCDEGQLEDFPRRMREWLYHVMHDYAERRVLQLQYLELEKQAEAMEKSWVNAVLWKFCDLDKDPEDRFIDRHELINLKAPIIPMEQCIIPFLDHCDVDSNHKITLKEWGHCLTLEKGEILDICVQSKPL